MARGVRLGWLDKSYASIVQRAWHGVAAHVGEDGTITDVCTSTGSGPTKQYYLDRPAITGADDVSEVGSEGLPLSPVRPSGEGAADHLDVVAEAESIPS